MSKIFYTIDEHCRVIPCCDWNDIITPPGDWRVGDISGAAYEKHGIPIYKAVKGNIVSRTEAEIRTDIDELPIEEPSEAEQLRADVDFLTMENEALESESEQARADIDYLLMITEEE